MVNINLAVSAKELPTVIKVLREEGLIEGQTKPVEVNPAPQMQQPVNVQPAQPIAPVQPMQQPVNVQVFPTQPVNTQVFPTQPMSVQPVIPQPVNVQPIPAQPLYTQPAAVNPVQPTPVPTTAPTYTLDQLSLAAVRGLMDTGRQAELHQILAEFGIQSLTQLPKEHYGLFATKLREKGCQI
jgi:hypothetical protein